MSKTMKAVVLKDVGGPEALELADVALPEKLGESEVLVRLEAAALNPADSFFRSLGPYLQSEEPCILGHDGAGTVEAVGGGVSRFKEGDRVCFCNGGIGGPTGTYAQFTRVPESQLTGVPENVDIATAAALPLVLITAWESLYERAGLAAGEYVLIHGGAGGTGHMCIQLAAQRGARIAATVSSAEKADFVRQLGAERPLLYRDEDFVEAAKDWTGGEGLHVALDNVGPDAMRKTFRAMAAYGRVVTLMGTPADDDDETAYVMNLTIHNVMMLTPMILGRQDLLDRQAGIVTRGMELLAAGKIAPVISKSFPLSEIQEAHHQLDAGGNIGKIVIDCRL